MDIVSGIVSGVAATSEAKDRKKTMKEEKKYRDKTLEMEEEKHKIFVQKELDKNEKEKEKQRITLETEELRKEKEKLELEMKKLEHEKLKSGDNGTSSIQSKESVLNLQKEKERLEIELKKLDLQQKQQQIKKINEVSSDPDTQFIEAATEGNIKMLTLYSKNIEDLDLDYIKAACDIAKDQGNPSVIRLTQLALDKKNKLENAKIEETKFKVKPSKALQKSELVGSDAEVEVLVPESKVRVQPNTNDSDFSEVVVKTMPDGSVMKMSRSKRSMKNSSADNSKASNIDSFSPFKDSVLSGGFKSSLLNESNFGNFGNFESRFSTDFGNFGNFESRLGQGRLSNYGSMFSGREGTSDTRNMMNDKLSNSSKIDINVKSINK